MRQHDLSCLESFLAIVVGHNRQRSGAKNYLGESEYDFNLRVAQKVFALLSEKGISLKLIQKSESSSYLKETRDLISQLKDLEIELVLELHFNYFSKPILGCEAIVNNLHHAEGLATDILDKLAQRGFRKRGVRLSLPGERGNISLLGLEKEGIAGIILEPCFGNFKTPESEFIFEREDSYCDLIANSIQNYLAKRNGPFSQCTDNPKTSRIP
jgi:N-acetylmuramoyl-L-alanine amidase